MSQTAKPFLPQDNVKVITGKTKELYILIVQILIMKSILNLFFYVFTSELKGSNTFCKGR